jgi:hypothetical protein
MLKPHAFILHLTLGQTHKETPKEHRRIVDWWHVDASTRPTHVRTMYDTRVDRRKTSFATNEFGCCLIKRDILLRKSSSFFFFNTGEKSLYRAMPTVESMVQI